MEPTKSILVVAPHNVSREDEFFMTMGMNVVTRIRSLGNFIGDREAEDIWLAKKVQGREKSVKTLSGVGRK